MGGQIEMMEFLLANGASLNEEDHRSNDCLLLACLAGNTKCVEYILDHFPQQLLHVNVHGVTPLMMAASYCQFFFLLPLNDGLLQF